MQISTIYEGKLITGVVLKHSAFFLEVEITSPTSKISTSRSVPYFARAHIRYEGNALQSKCKELLVELYKVSGS
jgi:hypothetical protein